MPGYARPYGDSYFQGRSAAKLPLESAKLDGELTSIVDWLNDLTFIQNASEWTVNPVIPTYISGTQFSLSGDVTDVFGVYRKVRVTIGTDPPVYSTVTSSAYASGTGLTTVTLVDSILQVNITQLCYGILGIDLTKSSFPQNLLNIPIRTVSTTPAAISRHDGLVLFDAVAASIAVTLPTCASVGAGKSYVFRKKDVSAYTVTFTPAGAETIDGAATLVLSQPYDTVIIVSNGSTGWELVQPRTGKIPAYFMTAAFGKLKVKNNASTPNTSIDLDADYIVVSDVNGNVMPLHGIDHTIDCTQAGLADGNCLDTGTLGPTIWYYIYEIAKPDETRAGLVSTSPSAPIMPAGFTFKQLVGAIKTDASSHFIHFVQFNKKISYPTEAQVLTGGTATTWTGIDLSSCVPPLLATRVVLRFEVHGGGGVPGYLGFDGVNTFHLQNCYTTQWFSPCQVSMPMINSQAIYYKVGSGNDVTICVQGYELDI